MNKKINNMFKIYLSKINYYFDKKHSILIFLLLLLGVMIPAFSGSLTNNFWYRLWSILTSPFLNFMFFISIGLNVIYVSSELSKSYNVVNRYTNYHVLIKKFIIDIISTTLCLSVVSFILAIAGAIILSFGDMSLFNHPTYNFTIVFYILFHIIKISILACIINSILYLLVILIKKTGTTILILVSSSIFMVFPVYNKTILHFYNVPLLYHYYFLAVDYITFQLEFISTLFQLFILILIYNFLYKVVTIKKRDLF